jgi:hypothetical protein
MKWLNSTVQFKFNHFVVVNIIYLIYPEILSGLFMFKPFGLENA